METASASWRFWIGDRTCPLVARQGAASAVLGERLHGPDEVRLFVAEESHLLQVGSVERGPERTRREQCVVG